MFHLSVFVLSVRAGLNNGAFYGCANLESITVDEGNQTYSSQDGILYNKAKTEIVHVPSAIKGAVTIPDGVKTIGKSASFSGCGGLTSIEIPDSVTSIGDYAFYDCTGLTGIEIPDSVTKIGDSAFSGCVGLKGITIPDGVTSIGKYAFRDCSGLTSVIIPDSVKTIGYYAFAYCDGLTRVDITDLAAWCKIDFESEYANPLTYAHHLYLDGEEVTTLTIPEEITEIMQYAFTYCDGLTSVTIGDGVTSIGDCAFYGCDGLTDIQFKGTVKEWQKIYKDSVWNIGMSDYIVTCTDGTVDKKGTVTYF